MTKHPTRRDVLIQGAATGVAAATGAGWTRAFAQGDDLEPYRAAKINWKQTEGETITVAVIPASYFENLISLQPQFEALTGIDLRFEKVPPGQIRQKALLDLSSKTATYATHAADPMYYPLYVSNKWVEPLDNYLNDATLTDTDWFKLRRHHQGVARRRLGRRQALRHPVRRRGDGAGLPQGPVRRQGAEAGRHATTSWSSNAEGADRPERAHLRARACAASPAPARTCTSTRRCFRGFGGEWMQGGKVVVNSPEAVKALTWYVDTLTAYAPPAVRNWNWPDIADAFSQGTVATYIDAHSSASVITNPEKSKVIGKVAYARWPKGPSGKRVTSIWNWGFPINAALTDKQKKATWLFIAWAASRRDAGAHVVEVRRAGEAFRRSTACRIWRSPEFAAAMKDAGDNFVPAALESLEQDTDVDWRPRVPQWPAIGETMATAIQAALVGQKKPKEALDEAQARITQTLKG